MFLTFYFKRVLRNLFNNISTATPGSAYQLLKKEAKLKKKKAQPKKYPANLHILTNDDEESK